MRRDFGIWLLVLCASVLFALWPQLDLGVSRVFFSPDEAGAYPGSGFIGRRSGALDALREASRLLPFVLFAIAALLGIATYVRRERLFVTPRGALFLASAFALGPGLLVNVAFKGLSGRARPMQIAEFGGDKLFSPAWTFADQCHHNCSFVSGEVSAAAWTLALALLAPPPLRGLAMALAAAFMALTAALRISSGAHFLSDTVVAIIVTQLCTLALYAAFFRHDGLTKSA